MKKYFLFLLLFLLVGLYGCSDSFPYKDYIGEKSFRLWNQDSVQVLFPSAYEGKILLVAFVFTNCPDICPMTTHNIQLLQKRVKEENLRNVSFAAITFDVDRDIPSVLKSYMRVRKADESNWSFLAGDRADTEELMKLMSIVAISGDTTFTEEKEPIYFFQHTDRITLVDQKLQIRQHYSGSAPDIEQIIIDIKKLGS